MSDETNKQAHSDRHSTHHVHRGPESLPCYCAATVDHPIGHEQALSQTPPPQTHVAGLSLSELQRAHVERQEEWCPDQKPDLSFRGNELGGECGEAQNVIKKLERERHGWRGSRDTVEHLADELADVIHCAILVAITAGIEIEPAVVAKFNSTSEKNGLSTFLATKEGSTDA